MRRREFIVGAGLTGATLARPMQPRAQQSLPVIGYLGLETPERYGIRLRAFRDGDGVIE